MKRRREGLTLFLDRDGVINKKRDNDYVKTLDEWEWRQDFLDNIAKLSARFQRIIIVTNQRGIALGLMTEDDLAIIHTEMIKKIHSLRGRIDGIFYCPHDTNEGCYCRKPKAGLALQARAKFSDISFSKATLIGDSESDIEMGNSVGMTTYLLSEDPTIQTNATKTVSSIGDILTLPGHVGGG